MIKSGELAYFALDQRAYKPIGRAHNFTSEAASKVSFLWGDEVYVIKVAAGKATVSAQGHHVKLPVAHLMEDPILCIYQIDCGQGDAALVHFPDGRWMMVDGGPPHSWSNSGKIAPDFLYWKMFVDQSWKNEFDFRKAAFSIDSLVVSHPDYDHFGGFMDMTRMVRSKTLEYGTVYHCGLGRYSSPFTKYENGKGHSQLGPVRGNSLPDAYMTALVDGFDDVAKYDKPRGGRRWSLAGDYRKWLNELRELHGDGVGDLRRIASSDKFLPGYEPGQSDVRVNILGPIVEKWRGKPAMRYMDTAGVNSMKGPSKTRNGHSVVLRLDYDNARILLTGDLNFNSQALLLQNVDPAEFKCHVAKACHHGSEDVSSTFLKAMSPMATVFSSGDNESYAHPRAKVIGMSGAFSHHKSKKRSKTKFLGLEEEKYVSPLIYSTELSRSVALHPLHAVFDADGNRVRKPSIQARGRTKAANGITELAGDWLLANKMVYGLVNIRTDGKRILMGVRKESGDGFQVEELDVS